MFYIKILDQTLAYQVDQIKVIEPEETELLKVVEDQDYVTLLTCTPYGVNSHRLLVRGVRTDFDGKKQEQVKKTGLTKEQRLLVIAAVVTTVVMLLLIIGVTLYRKKKMTN